MGILQMDLFHFKLVHSARIYALENSIQDMRFVGTTQILLSTTEHNKNLRNNNSNNSNTFNLLNNPSIHLHLSSKLLNPNNQFLLFITQFNVSMLQTLHPQVHHLL